MENSWDEALALTKTEEKRLVMPMGVQDLFAPQMEIVSEEEWRKKDELWDPIKEKIFIETGTFYGHGVMAALLRGCADIHSIEINPTFFMATRNRMMCLAILNKDLVDFEINSDLNFFSIVFGKKTRVNLYLGDTIEILPLILKEIDEPAFFWLDAHWSGDETKVEGVLDEESSPEIKCPIAKELSIIKEHSIKNHTIAIDDYNTVCQTVGSFENIKKEILKINSEYTIKTKDKPSMDDKIIIAGTN